jgi:hypothetical protein
VLTTEPARDVVAKVRELINTRGSSLRRLVFGDHADWGPDEENRARLLEIESYRLQLKWNEVIADPDEATSNRDRLLAKRAGIKPPRTPIIPPIALRPQSIADERVQTYLAELEEQQPKPRQQSLTRAEFDRAKGFAT